MAWERSGRSWSALTKVGAIKARVDGNRRYYAAREDHPLTPEVRGLVLKTMASPFSHSAQPHHRVVSLRPEEWEIRSHVTALHYG